MGQHWIISKAEMPNRVGAMKDWVAYYDSDHSIYVNARHRDVHYARLADAIARYVPTSTAAVLDYGCGEALHADRVADAAGRLTLAEAGPAVRGHLIERFKGNPKIMVMSTDRATSLLPGSFDMVILHSVSQYLTPEEFDRTAAVGLVRTFFSDYWWLRTKVGLTRYSEQEMARRLVAAGFKVTRARDNLG